MITYSFPIPNFFRNMQVGLKLMFNTLVGMEIEDYYEEIKEEYWNFGAFDTPITFYKSKSSEIFTNAKWVFSPVEGVNTYREIMSKKFTNAHFEPRDDDLLSNVSSMFISMIALFGVLIKF